MSNTDAQIVNYSTVRGLPVISGPIKRYNEKIFIRRKMAESNKNKNTVKYKQNNLQGESKLNYVLTILHTKNDNLRITYKWRLLKLLD